MPALSPPSLRTERAIVILFAALLFLPGLGGTDLWAPDEPTFAQASREMIAEGRFVLPHVNGRVFEDKPPLLFWLISLCSLPSGQVGSWSARLPSALSGIALVLLTFEIGRRLGGRRQGRYAALILATCWMTFDKARSAQTDMLLAACVAAALWCFLLRIQTGARGALAGFWLFCALGTLAKGPVGLILPAGIGACWLIASSDKGVARRFAGAAGPLLFAGIVGGWALAASVTGAAEGYDLFATLREQTIERFIQGRHHAESALYYFGALPRGLLPWSLLLPGALVVAARGRANATRGPLCWFLFTFGFFTLSTEKRDLYLLPLYPAFALLVASLLFNGEPAAPADQAAREAGGVLPPPPRPGPRPGISFRMTRVAPLAITSILLLALGVAALVLKDPIVLARYMPDLPVGASANAAVLRDAWQPARLGLIIAAAGGLAALVALRGGRAPGSAGILALATAASYLVIGLLLNPALNPVKSSRPLAAKIEAAARTSGSDRVVAYGLYRPGFSFYSSLLFTEAWDPGDLRALLRTDPDRLVLAQESDLEVLNALPGLSIQPLEQGSVGHREYVLLRIRAAEAAHVVRELL